MIIIGVPKESSHEEVRVSLTPENAKKLVALGAEVFIEEELGSRCKIKDAEYLDAGARVESRRHILSKSDIILRLRKPSHDDLVHMKKSSMTIGYLDPFNSAPLLHDLASKNITSLCMEMIPRISRAQKMDSLSSQASLAGYAAVIVAAEKSIKVFPMMMTPAGTISPSKVFIIGAGVAGLQAIATAKRLGARVEAFDTRPVVEEQVKSLGAKFIKVDLGETGQTSQGYAKELTKEQLDKQKEVMAEHCAASDVVITTAQIFGKKAPVIVTKEMIARMKPGSIIVDLAVETGGNVEGSVMGKDIEIDGVSVIGIANLPGKVAYHASQMYSNNILSLLLEFWDKEKKDFILNLEDDIIKGCLITHDGHIVNPMFAPKDGDKR
jgi:H+-translocating NAD(P) transhydrogenase subunit alpha